MMIKQNNSEEGFGFGLAPNAVTSTGVGYGDGGLLAQGRGDRGGGGGTFGGFGHGVEADHPLITAEDTNDA